MKLEEIRHEAVAVVSTWGDDSVRIAQEAEDVLGYSTLKKHQSKEDDTSPLLRVLSELGIEILNKDDVAKYQRQHQNEIARAKFEEWLVDPNRSSSFWSPSWSKHEIEKYGEPIPEFVLNKAIQIKKAMPEAVIFVEQLEENPDPFLIVATRRADYKTLMAEEFYVEVWAEPKFEGR